MNEVDQNARRTGGALPSTDQENSNTVQLSKAQCALVDSASDIHLDRGTAKDAAFLARQLIQATLPHSDPKSDTWTRRNGNFALVVQAGFNPLTQKTYGVPYGIIPRLLLFWITTEALRTKKPRLELGSSLAKFMRDVGLNPQTGGGVRGDARRLQEQMTRLFQARISFAQDLVEGDNHATAWLNMQVSRRGVLWWSTKNPTQGTLWESWIELEPDFFAAITSVPVPVDVRALRALKNSPIALDLYALCCYEAHKAHRSGRTRFIPWRSLMAQLGSDYEGTNAVRDFGVKARAALRKVKAVMPTLHLGTMRGGLSILPSSSPAIQPVSSHVDTLAR
jgi:hypothetical protein